MIFQSLYHLEDDAIIYYKQHNGTISVPFLDFQLVIVNPNGKLSSKAMDNLIQNPQSSLSACYHQAAIHQKYLPGEWDWQTMLLFKERMEYEKVAGEKAYLKAKGRITRPEFFGEYDFDEYLERITKWAKENGLFRTEEEIQQMTRTKIDKLIIERSQTEFIQLTSEQISQICG